MPKRPITSETVNLHALVELAHAFRERLTIEQMLQRTADTAAEVLLTPRASVRLLDDTNTRLITICRAGTPFHRNPETSFNIGEGLLGWIAAKKMPLCTGHAEQDPRFVPREDMKGTMGSFLGVPLLGEKGCIGVLSAVERSKDYFTLRHQDLLSLVAAICEPHIRNARDARHKLS